MSGSMNVTFSCCRYVSVFLAVCDDAPSAMSRSIAGILHGCLVEKFLKTLTIKISKNLSIGLYFMKLISKKCYRSGLVFYCCF